MSQIGRIGGPVLSADLLRDGSDLAFETDLLYLSVADLSNPLKTVGLGINNNSPSQKLQITGTSHFAKSDPLFPTDWIIDTQADLADLSFLTYKIQNTVGGTGGRIFIQPDQSVDPKIVTNEIRTAKLKLVNSSISTLLTDDNIEITANGLGQTQFYTTTVNINGNLAVTGNLQWDGNTITIGSDDTDRVIFNADINSNILPDVNNLYTLGSTTKKWNTVYSTNINTLTLEAAALTLNGIDMLLPQGNTIYVSVNGNDTNNGVHLHNTYRTVKHALSQAVAGDNIVVFPGTYIEDFPLTVPQGVSVTGTGIRAVTIYPSSGTNSNDAFLLNGETTVSHLTVGSFFYNSVNDTGYGFRLAPNCLVTTRSPYVQNISILNKGTAIDLRDTIDGGASATIIFDLILDGGEALPGYIDSINGGFANIDPTLGFASGDAGRGALVDGSTVHPDSKEASILFHSVTFIVPNANGVTATNGARVEWLNSFTYFANRGIYLTEGTAGFASLNIRFGAEFRSIGSANVYGTFGAVADGASTLGYLVGHNFAYIGTGADSQNDYDLVIQANEVVAINGGQLYYDSMDHKGDYRIGDIFYVNQQTGAITFNAQALDFSAGGSIVLEGASGRTEINAQLISTGNIVIHDNNIDSVLGPVNFLAQTGVTTLNTDVTVTGSLGVSGDVLVKGNVYLGNDPLDTVSVIPLLTQTIKPNLHNTFTLGTGGVTPKVWNTAYLTSVNVDNVTQLASNTITTLTTDTNLQLVASGTGVISAPLKSVDITNNLQVTGTTTVNGITSLKNTIIRSETLIPTTTQVNQNLSGTSGPTGFFFYGWQILNPGQTVPTFSVIQPGWTVVGQPTWVVSTVGDGVTNYDITITGGSFASGGTYSFTGDILTYGPKTLTQTGNLLQTGSTSITGNITSVNNITGYDYLQSSRIQISGNYISAIDLDADINFTAGGSNGVILDSRLKITDNTISNVWSGATTNAQKSIYFTPNGTGNVVINSTKAIQLPTSNDSNRVLTALGEVRLNSTTLVFEGKIAGGIIPLKGIYDSDRNTYITPELTVGANDNTLRFFNNGTLTTRINTTALLNNLIHIDNIQLSGNTVNNRITGDDLIFAPNTTGAINLNNLSFPENTIRNNTNGALTFNSTGVGYVKFGGTYGVVIPTGTGNPAYAPGTPQNQRPVTAEIGEVRHNTSLNYMEVYNGTIWIPAVGTLGAAPLGEVLDIMDFWSLILG